MWASRRNIRDASAIPTGIKREWYVCKYVCKNTWVTIYTPIHFTVEVEGSRYGGNFDCYRRWSIQREVDVMGLDVIPSLGVEWVLTAAAGTNGLASLLKHGGARDNNCWQPSDRPLLTLLTFRDRKPSVLTAGPSSSSTF
jgi:hypothetical protein